MGSWKGELSDLKAARNDSTRITPIYMHGMRIVEIAVEHAANADTVGTSVSKHTALIDHTSTLDFVGDDGIWFYETLITQPDLNRRDGLM